MKIDFVTRIKTRMKGAGPYRSAPVALTAETEALAVELGEAINALAGRMLAAERKLSGVYTADHGE